MRRMHIGLAIGCAAVALVTLTACAGGSTDPARQTGASTESTPGAFPGTTPPAPVTPPPVMNRDPESAVHSYLSWISLAYRLLRSDVASPTFTENEEVRVDSYVEFNRQQGRAIDQRLVGFEVRSTVASELTATVVASEAWRYRYISTATGDYEGETHAVSYDTTYTVVRGPAGGWRVERVEASPVGAPPQ